MNKPLPELEWAADQLDAINVVDPVRAYVLALLSAMREQAHNDHTKNETLDLFPKLAHGYALVPAAENEAWVQARPGQLVVRDEVRTRFDAYSDPIAGRAHNGRRGVIVAIRQGDIIVNYTDDREPMAQGVHHSPYALEKRVK